MIKTLDLHRIWEVLNILSVRRDILAEDDIYIYLLGYKSKYYQLMSYESFLEQYSFKINQSTITIYNDDGMPYEDYTNEDFNYFPIALLSMTDEEIEGWAEEEKDRQLEAQERLNIVEKALIEEKIKLLQRQLENLTK